jgi:hypothetical protein
VARGSSTFTVEAEGIFETLKAVRDVQADLRPGVNNELRDVAGREAEGLAGKLRTSASSSGVPVAPRVARSITVKRDRIPAVSIGGGASVGARGAPASALLWGSEHGGHNFAAAGGASGYWIKPAVEAYGREALEAFKRGVFEVFRKHGLL